MAAAGGGGSSFTTRSGRVVLTGESAKQAEQARLLQKRLERLKATEDKVGKEMFKLQLQKANYELGEETGPFKGIPRKIDNTFIEICKKYGGLEACLDKTQEQIRALEEGDQTAISDPAVEALLSAFGGLGLNMGGGYRKRTRRHRKSHRKVHRKAHRKAHRKSRRRYH